MNPLPELNGLCVLVVDDESDARELIACLLGMRGAEVHQADAPTAARAILERHAPHVMISDINMPGEDGYSLMRSVRSLERNPNCTIPAIALTALTSDVDRARAAAAGFDRHMPKPLDVVGLLQAVSDLGRTRYERIGA